MAVNKVEFCRRFILPKTRVVPKYIGLYRRLLKSERGVLAFKKVEKRAIAAAAATSSSSSSSPTVSPSRSPVSDNSVNKCSDSDDGKADTKGSGGGDGVTERQGEEDESEIEDF